MKRPLLSDAQRLVLQLMRRLGGPTGKVRLVGGQNRAANYTTISTFPTVGCRHETIWRLNKLGLIAECSTDPRDWHYQLTEQGRVYVSKWWPDDRPRKG